MYRDLHPRQSRRATCALLLTVLIAACTGTDGRGSAGARERDVTTDVPVTLTSDGSIEPFTDRPAIEAIRAGYVERLRLGLGSPFRLIDFALADPRLTTADRRSVASTLLEQTQRGRMYEIDPGVLQPGSDPSTPESLSRATRHLEVIERAIAEAEDPRAGELSIRLGYQLARLENAVGAGTLASAVRVAALVRDRELARRDAHALVRAAREAGADPIDLVPQWRAQRRFWVERPVLQTVAVTVEQAAIDRLPRLLYAIRLAAGAGDSPHRPPLAAGADTASLRLLRELPSLPMPPRASIVVPLRTVSEGLPPALSETDRAAWSIFIERARSEEDLAALAAEIATTNRGLRGPVARSVLGAAIALRSDAQEDVWFPGMSAPTAAELFESYGLRVSARDEVPAEWVPFVLASIESALSDLRAIVPRMNLQGLEVAITQESAVPSALASHSPRTRVIDLPVATGLGTIAHEIAHDLDWQSARRSNPRARTYASDQVAATSGDSQFRSAVTTLTPGIPDSWGLTSTAPETLNRPAEVVARTFDWFVVTRLAARGRWNGALSTGQDEILTGHGSIQPPGSSGTYGTAAVRVMRPLAILPETEIDAFLAQYGPTRGARAIPLLDAFVRQAGGIGGAGDYRSVAEEGANGIDEIFGVRDRFADQLTRQQCVTQPALLSMHVSPAYVRLVDQAARAKSRGYALSTGERIGGSAGRAWMQNRLFGPLWPAVELDESLVESLETLAAASLRVPTQGVSLASTFDYGIGATACGRHAATAFGGASLIAPGFPAR